MRDYEQRWVNESIPALGSMTPRQALDDPEMRGEPEVRGEPEAFSMTWPGTPACSRRAAAWTPAASGHSWGSAHAASASAGGGWPTGSPGAQQLPPQPDV